MLLAALGLALGSGTGQAETRDVLTGPPPAWVVPPPAGTNAPTATDAAFRFVYSDTQISIGPDSEAHYSTYRVKLLKPEALVIGNLSLVWSPDSGDATIHKLTVWRESVAIDMLKAARFIVMQREGGLETAMLDGLLTAAYQVPGLRVGDELEFAATVRRRDPILRAEAFGVAQLPTAGLPGAYRTRLRWPEAVPIVTRTTRDLPPALPTATAGFKAVSFEVRDPAGSIPTDGAPPRFNIRRQVEYSSFANWPEVSRLFAPLYADAAVIDTRSPLWTEVTRIKAASTNPAARAMAALRLAQDQVRYVYVGLNGGNYRPATTAETWERRYGDCKAKTALLLGLLRAMDIPADAVLVNIGGDDGVDRRLPSPGVFNHVLVRARIGGIDHWLDGTRLGDRHLDRIPAPAFRWALALTAKGAMLEAVPERTVDRPQFVQVIDIDATGGFAIPAKVKASVVMHDDEAFAIQSQLAALSAGDADRAVRAYWNKEHDWIDADNVDWRYDERGATLVLNLSGNGKLDWKGDDASGRNMTVIAGGFYPPGTLKRPKDQDQSAPWSTEFPRFRCWVTTVRLPPSPKFGWSFNSRPMNLEIGGARWWRATALQGNVARLVKSRRVFLAELTAAQATASNAAIDGFDNNMASVDQVSLAAAKDAPASRRAAPFDDATDWTGDAPACSPPIR